MRKILIPILMLMASWSTTATAAEILSQQQFSLQRFAEAKVIYLDFWASWCVPCRHSFPWLNAMQAKYAAQGLVVVGVNVDPDRADADRFLTQYPAAFTLVMDPDGVLAEQWKLQGMPSAVLLSPDGRELHRHIGFRADHQQDYEQLIQQLLLEANHK